MPSLFTPLWWSSISLGVWSESSKNIFHVGSRLQEVSYAEVWFLYLDLVVVHDLSSLEQSVAYGGVAWSILAAVV